MTFVDEVEIGAHLAPELGRRERDRTPVLAQDPGRELPEMRVLGDEDAVLDPSVAPEQPVDPPGGVPADLDLGLALRLSDLPRRPLSVLLRVEALGHPEVALAASRQPDVAADPGHAEGLDLLVVEVEPDDVPLAAVEEQRIRVHRPLAQSVAHDRPVLELQGAVLGDRALELRQPARELRGVTRVVELHGARGLGRRLVEAGPAEREVLQCQSQRLRVGELALEQIEAGLQRRELFVGQLERGQEVALGAEPVELLARELVALGVERDAERKQLGTVRVEAAREGLVRHLLVALDVLLHVPRGQGPPLGHEEGHERELADQLVGVVRHTVDLFFQGGVSRRHWKQRRRVCNKAQGP